MKTVCNILGLVAFLPLLLASAMSFAAPGSGEHWAHWFFVGTAVAIGPASLIGLLVKRVDWLGLASIALFALASLLLVVFCAGAFSCRSGLLS
ncbi:hypothetical protein [Dokdonella sp.]|uniref:hypothetical protein n=1 Tax=Dokdonella sp. TaxID=2291710 RepID=UPI0025C59814|nr:hypothetical protein [Dokdonella sp.]MBX3687946.1 hypothetical protein [Dokdonella sp.]